jgi:hypothetical protein
MEDDVWRWRILRPVLMSGSSSKAQLPASRALPPAWVDVASCAGTTTTTRWGRALSLESGRTVASSLPTAVGPAGGNDATALNCSV